MVCQADDDEIIRNQFIRDDDRSAFGLGYEYARRDVPADENPFPSGSDKYRDFYSGWKTFRQIARSR